MKNQSVFQNIDWLSVFFYIALVVIGWLNIYSSTVTAADGSIIDLSKFYGKQLLFICFAFPLILITLFVDGKIFEKYTSIIYVISILSLLGLFVFGKTVKGQANWYSFGSFGLQPSEFAKAATSLALAKFLSDSQINLKSQNNQLLALAIVLIPMIIIAIHDPGSALIYLIFFIVLYREGLPGWYLVTGLIGIVIFVLTLLFNNPFIIIGITTLLLTINYFKSKRIERNILLSTFLLIAITVLSFSVNYVFNNVFQKHHRDRFNILLGKQVEEKGIGYNVDQSEIAIGSGGWFGKGFLEGTQTKGGFVPEQHSDYIFTTIGEEWGFMGSVALILLFVGLCLRVVYLAERQKSKFSRVYGYCVASILFFHFFVNLAMVSGIFPTVGVPLPFISYGGSSLWGFTILLFIFLKLDANKVNEW